MSALSQADRFLVERIQEGDGEAWKQLVDRYRGRLLAFARSRVRSVADAEDLLQDTFVCFLRGIGTYRGEAGLETYLFTILRRRIIDWYRGRKVSVCLLQDTAAGREEDESEPLGNVPAPEPTASWYARRDERRDAQREALGKAIRKLVSTYKSQLNFRDLKIVEMLFFCQLANRQAAKLAEVNDKQIALIKHRCLKRVRADVEAEMRRSSVGPPSDSQAGLHDAMLTEVWEDLRASCPKRNTIGAYLLGSLEEEWHEYVRFHVETLGCRFCQANLEDLQEKTADRENQRVRNRILESTVGFLRRSTFGDG